MLAAAFQIVGFLLAVAGVAAWSGPAACVVAGVVLFVAGGREQARR
jgi:hypothetical protein